MNNRVGGGPINGKMEQLLEKQEAVWDSLIEWSYTVLFNYLGLKLWLPSSDILKEVKSVQKE